MNRSANRRCFFMKEVLYCSAAQEKWLGNKIPSPLCGRMFQLLHNNVKKDVCRG